MYKNINGIFKIYFYLQQNVMLLICLIISEWLHNIKIYNKLFCYSSFIRGYYLW